jgi:putative copper resistance protein D
VVGLTVIAVTAMKSGAGRQSLAVVGATLTLSSFLFTGHTADHAQRWLLAILLIIHLMIAAFWFGALLAFLVTATRESPQAYGVMVRDFSKTASLLVPFVLLAGLLMAFVLMPDLAALSAPYGNLLLFKIAAFTLLMTLAAWNKFRLSPALVSQAPGALTRFGRIVAVEWILIALVLGATAIMTGLFSPE